MNWCCICLSMICNRKIPIHDEHFFALSQVEWVQSNNRKDIVYLYNLVCLFMGVLQILIGLRPLRPFLILISGCFVVQQQTVCFGHFGIDHSKPYRLFSEKAVLDKKCFFLATKCKIMIKMAFILLKNMCLVVVLSTTTNFPSLNVLSCLYALYMQNSIDFSLLSTKRFQFWPSMEEALGTPGLETL